MIYVSRATQLKTLKAEAKNLLLIDTIRSFSYLLLQNIVDEQLLLKRISNVIINIFGMTAVLSRATRTKAKGDLNADYEVNKALL